MSYTGARMAMAGAVAGLSAMMPLTVAAETAVHAVSAEVTSTAALPASIQERLEASVTVIGERVFLGRDADELTARRPAYTGVIADVVGRVALGYAVTDVQLTPGPTTRIHVAIAPYGETVRTVTTSIDYGNLSPTAKALVAQDLADIPEEVRRLFVGLPVDSLDWVGGISETVLRDRLAAHVPEFTVTIECVAEPDARVAIYLIPKGEIVRDGQAVVRGGSLPRLLLADATRAVERALPDYAGLPVDFVRRHRETVAQQLLATARERAFVQQYAVQLQGDVEVDRTLRFVLHAYTDKWRIEGQVRMDAGRETDSASLRGLVARRIGSHDAIFTETVLYPGTLTWDWSVGWWHDFGSALTAGYQYHLTDGYGAWIWRYRIGLRWYLRGRHPHGGENREWAVGYRPREYIGLEYVRAEDDQWLRLIGYV